MPINRYTNLSYSSLRDLPHLTLPYEALDNLLGQQQQQIDITKSVTDLVPDYIQDSPSDRNLAGQIMKYQQDVKAQLAEIAKTGNVSAYTQALNQVQEQVKRLYQPGGAADILKQRKLQDVTRRKQIEELYKTNPKIAEYYKRTTPYGEVGYNTQTGEYNPITGYGNVKPHVEEKDINTWFNTNLDNVKNSLLDEGVAKSKLDGITSMYDFWQLDGVPKEKLIGVFTTLFPKEFQDSIYQSVQADRYFAGDATPIDTNLFTKDGDSYKLNTQNPIASMIQGYATLGERKELKHDRIKDDNEIALEAYKSQLRRREKEEEEANLVIRTLPASKAVPKDVKYYTDGTKIKQNTNASADATSKKAKAISEGNALGIGLGPLDLGYTTALKIGSFFDRLFTSNDEIDVDSSAELSNVRDHLVARNPEMAKASKEDINKAVVNELNTATKGSIDARYTAGSSKFKKQFDDIFVPVLDKDGKLLNTGNLVNFKFQDREGSIIPGQNFATEATKEGVTISYKGAVTDVASDLQYGSTVLAVGNDEIYMEPDEATTYDPNTLISGAYRAMNNAEVANTSNFKYKGKDTQMMFKPDGTFIMKDKGSNTSQILYPIVDDGGNLVGLSPTKN